MAHASRAFPIVVVAAGVTAIALVAAISFLFL